MFLHLESVKFFHRLDEGVEIFTGDLLNFLTLTADERVVAVIDLTLLHLAADVTLDAMHFVDEVELFEDLNNAIDGNGVEIDFVFLESDLGDLVWRK